MKWNDADKKIMRPPVEALWPVLGFLAADVTKWGRVALRVLKEPIVSMSITVLNALAESPAMGERKFPAAPALLRFQYGEWPAVL